MNPIAKRSTENSGKSTGSKRGRVDNLRPWKPGESGNPGGRPKVAALSQACREVLGQLIAGDPQGRTCARAIADTLAEKALSGDIRAAQELADRAEGRPRQSLEIENTTLHEAFERMSREELEAYASTGALPAWFPGRAEAGE